MIFGYIYIDINVCLYNDNMVIDFYLLQETLSRVTEARRQTSRSHYAQLPLAFTHVRYLHLCCASVPISITYTFSSALVQRSQHIYQIFGQRFALFISFRNAILTYLCLSVYIRLKRPFSVVFSFVYVYAISISRLYFYISYLLCFWGLAPPCARQSMLLSTAVAAWL